MINDFYINFMEQKLMFADLTSLPYLIIVELFLNYSISLISCHFPFKTS
jgi:hypothetical protein